MDKLKNSSLSICEENISDSLLTEISGLDGLSGYIYIERTEAPLMIAAGSLKQGTTSSPWRWPLSCYRRSSWLGL